MDAKQRIQICQKLMEERGLNNQRTITYTDKARSNIGHTIPWSYEKPTNEETAIIEGDDFDKLKNLISSKRVNLNKAKY